MDCGVAVELISIRSLLSRWSIGVGVRRRGAVDFWILSHGRNLEGRGACPPAELDRASESWDARP